MEQKIFDIQLGINHCYLIKGKEIVMMDAGVPKKIKQFKNQLKKLDIDPKDIKLIVVSHAHFDHVGSLADIVDYTGARVVVHELDRENLEKGRSEVPKGNSRWGRMSIKLLKPFMKEVIVPGVIPDIILKDKDYSLKAYGIDGKIIHTPGHTMGSLSILLDTGEAFVGCMSHNMFPFTLRPRTPIFAGYPDVLNESWKKLMAERPKKIFPGHGKAFPAEKMLRFIK